MLLVSCGKSKQNETVARKYCSGCHLFPEPALLDKKTWRERVLPEMAFRMGLDMSKIPGTSGLELNEILKTLPARPMVSEQEWKSIRDYYLSIAPDTLDNTVVDSFSPLQQFTASTLSLPIKGKTLLTLVKADPASHDIFIATRRGQLYLFNDSFATVDSFLVRGAPSDLMFAGKGSAIISCMGIMDPNDLPSGAVVSLDLVSKKVDVIIDSIKRPVDIQAADLNSDHEDELIISAFGNFTGGLIAYEKKPGGYRPHIIHNFAGTRKTIVRDFNGDGLPDILALITQGDERLALFTNRGDFRFSFQVLLKFPPVYGSSYFDLVDFNGDGKEDIVYTNGDNADYSAILKPYHGVRIFLNDGKNHFSEFLFFPMHGASMALARDFDQDGDVDIAALSFFPDFRKRPENSFIYLRNDQGKLIPFTTPLSAESRWITMECADIDHDRDEDLILAALAFPTGVPDSLFNMWMKKQNSLLILRNSLH
jgi:hypothetical protein